MKENTWCIEKMDKIGLTIVQPHFYYFTECFSLVHQIELYVNRMEENELNEK